MAPAPQSDCEQGWTLSLEAMALRPYQSDDAYNQDSYEFAGRISVGYQFNDCLFTKVTYFGYDQEVYTDNYNDGDGYINNYNTDLKVSYLDWVVGQHFKPSDKLTLSPFVGLRWGTFDDVKKHLYDDNGSGYKYTSGDEFSGLGVVVGIEGTRSLGNSFSLYGTAKQSVLFGSRDEIDRQSAFGDTNYSTYDDTTSSDSVGFVSELGLGVQYDFTFSNVAANIRAGVEGQYWAGLSDGANTGLAGFVLGANFRF